MIVFADIMGLLRANGWTLYRLRKENIFSGGAVEHIRRHEHITTRTVDTICRLCHCQPGDIMKYAEDPEKE